MAVYNTDIIIHQDVSRTYNTVQVRDVPPAHSDRDKNKQKNKNGKRLLIV